VTLAGRSAPSLQPERATGPMCVDDFTLVYSTGDFLEEVRQEGQGSPWVDNWRQRDVPAVSVQRVLLLRENAGHAQDSPRTVRSVPSLDASDNDQVIRLDVDGTDPV